MGRRSAARTAHEFRNPHALILLAREQGWGLKIMRSGNEHRRRLTAVDAKGRTVGVCAVSFLYACRQRVTEEEE